MLLSAPPVSHPMAPALSLGRVEVAEGGEGSTRSPPMDALAAGARLCSIVVFGIHTIQSVISDPVLQSLPRDLDLVELWSGVGSFVAAGLALECAAAAFYLRWNPGVTDADGPGSEVLSTQAGFINACRLIMRVRPRGLVHQAPECSSFVFAPVSVTGRSKENFAGDPNSSCAQVGNQKAMIAMFLFCLAATRGCHCLMENPAGSMIFSFLDPFLRPLMRHLVVSCCDRCAYQEDAPRESVYKKHYKWLCSGTWIRKAMRQCSCGNKRHEPLMIEDSAGHKNGRSQHLKNSAAYPKGLGMQIVANWHEVYVKDISAPGEASGQGSGAEPNEDTRGQEVQVSNKTPLASSNSSIFEDAWGTEPHTSSTNFLGTQQPGKKRGRLQTAAPQGWALSEDPRAENHPAASQGLALSDDPWAEESTPAKARGRERLPNKKKFNIYEDVWN